MVDEALFQTASSTTARKAGAGVAYETRSGSINTRGLLALSLLLLASSEPSAFIWKKFSTNTAVQLGAAGRRLWRGKKCLSDVLGTRIGRAGKAAGCTWQPRKCCFAQHHSFSFSSVVTLWHSVLSCELNYAPSAFRCSNPPSVVENH